MVQTNTVLGPGGEAGLMRIKGTSSPDAAEGPIGDRALAMALDGNGRWAYLDPKLGAMHAVAECARKVAMTGAKPVAATNCLNFGNPEKPEIMAQLSAAIDGIGEACTALGTPITGGNVSLYNETKGEGIYPTPVLGIVGILEDVFKAVPADFQRAGDAIVLLWPVPRGEEPNPTLEVPFKPEPMRYYPVEIIAQEPVPEVDQEAPEATADADLIAFGSSEYAKVILGSLWGTPPPLDLEAEASLHKLLAELADERLLRLGPRHLRRRHRGGAGASGILERHRRNRRAGSVADGSSALRSLCRTGLDAAGHDAPLESFDDREAGRQVQLHDRAIGTTGGDRLKITVDGEPFISAPLTDLRKPWASALEAILHDEVTA